MFNKIKEAIQAKTDKILKEKAQRDELKKAQTYYNLVKAGAAFIQLVQQDIAMQGDKMNRENRRKMEQELNKNGRLTPEMVEYYKQRIDWVLGNIHARLNPPKQKPVQTSPDVQVSKDKPEDA